MDQSYSLTPQGPIRTMPPSRDTVIGIRVNRRPSRHLVVNQQTDHLMVEIQFGHLRTDGVAIYMTVLHCLQTDVGVGTTGPLDIALDRF
jgi:hypothetical protein